MPSHPINSHFGASQDVTDSPITSLVFARHVVCTTDPTGPNGPMCRAVRQVGATPASASSAHTCYCSGQAASPNAPLLDYHCTDPSPCTRKNVRRRVRRCWLDGAREPCRPGAVPLACWDVLLLAAAPSADAGATGICMCGEACAGLVAVFLFYCMLCWQRMRWRYVVQRFI